MRYSYEFKRKCVEMYYRGEYPDTPEGVGNEYFHKKVRETFLELAKSQPHRFVIIDASKSPEEVASAALDAILARLCK